MHRITSLALSLLLALTSMLATADTPPSERTADQNAALVIYRPKQTASLSGVHFKVYLDGKLLAAMKPDSHQIIKLTAGVHTLVVNDRKRSRLTFTAHENTSTIIRAFVRPTPKMDLGTATVDEAIAEAPSLSEVLPAS